MIADEEQTWRLKKKKKTHYNQWLLWLHLVEQSCSALTIMSDYTEMLLYIHLQHMDSTVIVHYYQYFREKK